MLVRKNIMIEDKLWNSLEALNDIREMSISKIIGEAVNQYLEKERENNLAFKVRMIAENNKISKEEEKEFLEELEKLSPDDRKIVSQEAL